MTKRTIFFGISNFVTSDNNFTFKPTTTQSIEDNQWILDEGYSVDNGGIYTLPNKVVRIDPSKNWTIASEWTPSFSDAFFLQSEIQQISVIGNTGTWTVQYGIAGTPSGPLAYNIGTDDLILAIEGLVEWPLGGTVEITGGPGNSDGDFPYVITFGGTLENTNVDELVADGTYLMVVL